MQIELDYVVGVDTHLDEHVLGRRRGADGSCRRETGGAREPGGYAAALRFAGEAANGTRAWAIEGAGHYGAGLARFLAGRGESVLELSRTPRAERRLRGKDDSLDAIRTARAALASETHALPRSGEQREALRLLADRTPRCRRRPPRSARTASQRDRHRPRPAP